MPSYPGPKANLKARHRRSGRAGTVWKDGRMLGDVVAVEWNVEIEQIRVAIPGRWQDMTKPGAESRAGTFRFQDIDDEWRRLVYGFIQARKNGDRAAAAQFPQFDLMTQIDDVGAPGVTRWAVRGCELFSYSGGFSQDDDLLVRDVAFTFEDDEPLDSFIYTDSGVVTF